MASLVYRGRISKGISISMFKSYKRVVLAPNRPYELQDTDDQSEKALRYYDSLNSLGVYVLRDKVEEADPPADSQTPPPEKPETPPAGSQTDIDPEVTEGDAGAGDQIPAQGEGTGEVADPAVETPSEETSSDAETTGDGAEEVIVSGTTSLEEESEGTAEGTDPAADVAEGTDPAATEVEGEGSAVTPTEGAEGEADAESAEATEVTEGASNASATLVKSDLETSELESMTDGELAEYIDMNYENLDPLYSATSYYKGRLRNRGSIIEDMVSKKRAEVIQAIAK